MLKSWSIQNFKAIVDSGNLKLAPVTVLAGRNSSGKSCWCEWSNVEHYAQRRAKTANTPTGWCRR